VRIAPGSTFPDAVVTRLEGGSLRLGEAWAHGPGLVAIGHSECGTTRLALPFIDRIRRRRTTGTVLAVFQEDRAGARAMADELGLDLPVGLDEDPYPLCTRLGLQTVPTLILVRPGGVVDDVLEGFARDRLEAMAAALGATPLFEAGDTAPIQRPG
jgi:hypothetical protein